MAHMDSNATTAQVHKRAYIKADKIRFSNTDELDLLTV